MKNSKLRLLSATLLACVLGLTTAVSQAQNFPSKTIRVIEPAGPGSAVDTAVRDIIPALNEVFGQQVYIDNKPGGNSLIGAREAIRAPADGHTLFHGNINNALNDLFPNTNCCRLGEALLPVTRIFSTPLVLVVNHQRSSLQSHWSGVAGCFSRTRERCLFGACRCGSTHQIW